MGALYSVKAFLSFIFIPMIFSISAFAKDLSFATPSNKTDKKLSKKFFQIKEFKFQASNCIKHFQHDIEMIEKICKKIDTQKLDQIKPLNLNLGLSVYDESAPEKSGNYYRFLDEKERRNFEYWAKMQAPPVEPAYDAQTGMVKGNGWAIAYYNYLKDQLKNQSENGSVDYVTLLQVMLLPTYDATYNGHALGQVPDSSLKNLSPSQKALRLGLNPAIAVEESFKAIGFESAKVNIYYSSLENGCGNDPTRGIDRCRQKTALDPEAGLRLNLKTDIFSGRSTNVFGRK